RLGADDLSVTFGAARIRGLKDRFILKVLHPRLARDPETRAAFIESSKSVKSVWSTSFARILEIGDELGTGGDPYIIYEQVKGENLAEVLAQEQGMRPREALDIARKIGVTLDNAHKKGVVHRHLKPARICIKKQGLGGAVKILDLGFACIPPRA
ncbi:MAG: protein kinase, partial [Deltaproteobacteria bacterium]|nr:protein kinase [Deltaproteobacteria bacterium]